MGGPVPVELRAPRGARVVEIEWSDGVTTSAHHRVLRAFCPCAGCQGHDGPIRWVASVDALADDALELVEIEEVGQYALRFAWGDGHGTGIYTFRFLRAVSDLAAAEDPRAHTFGR